MKLSGLMAALLVLVAACGDDATTGPPTPTLSPTPLTVSLALTQPDGPIWVEGYIFLEPVEPACEPDATCPEYVLDEKLCFDLSLVEKPTCVGAPLRLEGLGGNEPAMTVGEDGLTSWSELVVVTGTKEHRTITIETVTGG